MGLWYRNLGVAGGGHLGQRRGARVTDRARLRRGRWPRRYASTLFFASLLVIWVGASLVIVVLRNHL